MGSRAGLLDCLLNGLHRPLPLPSSIMALRSPTRLLRRLLSSPEPLFLEISRRNPRSKQMINLNPH